MSPSKFAARAPDICTRLPVSAASTAATSSGGNYPARSLSTVFMGIYIRFGVSGKERNPYLE